MALSQLVALAFSLTLATTSRRVLWIQSFSWAAQTRPRVGGSDSSNSSGARRRLSGGAATIPLPVLVSNGWNVL